LPRLARNMRHEHTRLLRTTMLWCLSVQSRTGTCLQTYTHMHTHKHTHTHTHTHTCTHTHTYTHAYTQTHTPLIPSGLHDPHAPSTSHAHHPSASQNHDSQVSQHQEYAFMNALSSPLMPQPPPPVGPTVGPHGVLRRLEGRILPSNSASPAGVCACLWVGG